MGYGNNVGGFVSWRYYIAALRDRGLDVQAMVAEFKQTHPGHTCPAFGLTYMSKKACSDLKARRGWSGQESDASIERRTRPCQECKWAHRTEVDA